MSVGPSLGGIECLIINSPPVPPVDTSASIVSFSSGTAGTPVILSEVPTSTWTYGCSATAAGMLFGYYDRAGYPDMYTGPANGGLAPLTDLGQGDDPDNPIAGACSIIATQQGFDGRITPGHVDDYWTAYESEGPDPWEASGIEHTWGDCTADFMGTNQWKWDFDGDGVTDGITDGGTWFYSNDDGTPAYDYVPPAEYGLPQTEGCHGLRLFAESRGYTVETNFTQKIDAAAAGGFTFADLQDEIDAGRPLMAHMYGEVGGHTVLIVGYNTDGSTIYIHDTWDNETHWMTWGGDYAEMTLESVTVLRLEATPTADAGGPYTADEGSTITLSAKGSCDPTGIITSYAWDLDNDGQYDDGNDSTASFSRIADGVYTVRVRVTGSSSGMDTDTATVTVVNVSPSVTLNGPGTIDEGTSVTLTASATDPGQDILSYLWDLDGDGQYDDATGATADFLQKADGDYTVSVKVTDNSTAMDLVTANADSDTVSVLRNLGDGQFATQATFQVGKSPHAVAAADLDGDGAVDLVTADYGSNTVSVLRNLGDLKFESHGLYAVGSKPVSIITADVDGDNDVDLVTADYGADTVSILKNLGDGTFAPAVACAVGTDPFFVTAADINGDHAIDLITADYADRTLSVLLNQGNGTFVLDATCQVGSEPMGVTAADVNGDDAADLITSNRGSNTVSVLLQNPADHTFAPQVVYTVGSKPVALTPADVNGDGAVDLAVANSYSDTISILRNQGNGTFAPQVALTVGKNPYSVTAADVDEDGTLDLVAANRGANTVSVLRNLGGGAFAPQTVLAVGSLPLSVTAVPMAGNSFGVATTTITVQNVAPTAYAGGPYSVDLGQKVRLSAAGTIDPGHDVESYRWDLDGDDDFDDAEGQAVYYTPPAAGTFTVSVRVTDDDGAFSDADAGLTVYDPANPTASIPGDANRNGVVNAADATILLAHWGLSGMTWANGDFNGDGLVNADDAAILTAHWGGTSGGGTGTGTGSSTTGSIVSFSTPVGPARSPVTTVRRSVRPIAASRSLSESAANSAATDDAVAQDYAPQVALARSRTLARRQSRQTRPLAPSPLAVDLILSDPSA